MRIRKRWPPPPPPLAPDPLSSTLHLPASSEEEEIPNPKELHYALRPPSDSPNHPLRQPSDLQLLMVRGTNGWICSTSERNDEKNEEQKKEKLKKDDYLHPNLTQEREEDAEEKKEAVSNLRNGKNPSAEAWLSSSNQEVRGRWCEGERDFPLKKKKGSFEQKTSKEMKMEKEKMKMKTKMKSKTNKKLVFEEDGKEDEYRVNGHAIIVKKKGNGGVIMEGSRCSRVNGRGWRCCQQTLVGYSLCEHHLGKGRLRSMSSFKSRGGSTITKLKKVEQDLELSPLMVRKSFEDEVKEDEEEEDDDDDDADEEEEEDEKPLMIISKKRKKIGMVKARSISSLLGQTLHAPPVTEQ